MQNHALIKISDLNRTNAKKKIKTNEHIQKRIEELSNNNNEKTAVSGS